MDAARRTLLWLRPDQTDLARALAERIALDVAAIGSPPATRATPAADAMGSAFPDAEPIDDLRHTLTSAQLDLALFLTADPPEPGAPPDAAPCEDPEILRYCRGAGVIVATLEPSPASALACRTLAEANLLAPIRVLPLLAHSPVLADAADAISTFGPIRTVAVAARAARPAGSLGARLFDAMHLLHALLGLPESIDAAYVPHQGLAPQPGTHTPPESIRLLHGDLTANLRYPPGHAASLTLSSRGGRWFRGVTLLSDSGCLRLDETGFQRFDPQGELVDASEPRQIDGPPGLAAIADALARLLDPHKPDPRPINLPPVLAMCEAAVLSAHTAQAEPPAAILRMAGAD